ncbi:hypothetical protein MKW94_028103 [Papaver nudicaule]|uniref:UBX domain-containing protein n=1 Tax=Papaver nudicaule TaxID=74823 RepID=A0AA41S614_PAPNU|nr:hypothetical protein [Papaver nudicaule]
MGDDMNDKLKDFLRKVNSSSPSSPFKGQGRVLGASSEPPKNDPYKNVEPEPNSSSNPSPNPNSSVSGSNLDKSRPDHDRSSEDGVNKLDSLVTSSKRSQNGHSIEICECPACVKAYRTAEEVIDHIESCSGRNEVVETADLDEVRKNLESRNELGSCVGFFVSGEPPEGWVRLKMVSGSSLSSGFKGKGRVLGTASSSSEPPKNNPYKNVEPPKKPSLNPNRYSKSTISSKPSSDHDRSSTDGFNKFDSLITSSKRSQNGHSIQIYECPVCGKAYRTVKEVTEHIESCLGQNEVVETADLDEVRKNLESRNELASCVGVFVSGEPPGGSVEVVMRLLRNVVSNPENDKFRRIRMGNPKIKEAIGSVTGGVELLECVGFKLQEEGEEMWAVMEVPTGKQINSIKEVILMLEPKKVEAVPPTVPKAEDVIAEEPKKVNRQVRVFIPAPNTEAANIELPDSFYKLSMEEIKAEADIRKKKLAESQLLVPRSFKEKQAKAARKKYNATTIRIQFPDEVILQGVFEPRERTTALYEFVRSSLKEPRLEFELRHHPPFLKRRPGIPCFSGPGKTAPTLDEEDLVPAALVRFFPLETDSTCFTGLSDECLEMITQLTSDDTAVSST